MNNSAEQSHENLGQLVEAIHATEYQGVIALTGGGSQALSQLLTTVGASRTLLEGVIPYAQAALVDLLGDSKLSACSEATARAMAMVCWERAKQLAPSTNPEHWIGLGCTASLATDRPKRGSHRIHVAAQTASLTTLVSLTLVKDARTRSQEEEIAARMLLVMLAQTCGLEGEADFHRVQELLLGEEQWEMSQAVAPQGWTDLLTGALDWVPGIGWESEKNVGGEAGSRHEDDPPILFPGSFNPPHAGHLQMSRLAAAHFGRPVTWELSIQNVDKRPLDFIEISQRLSELQNMLSPKQERSACRSVVVTMASTFVEKGELFPGCSFVVGADTLLRIGQSEYYGHDPDRRDEAIDKLTSLGCRFLVFGRLCSQQPQSGGDGQGAGKQPQNAFCTLQDLPLPESLRALCSEVPATKFRSDLSSTQLRSTQRQSAQL